MRVDATKRRHAGVERAEARLGQPVGHDLDHKVSPYHGEAAQDLCKVVAQRLRDRQPRVRLQVVCESLLSLPERLST